MVSLSILQSGVPRCSTTVFFEKESILRTSMNFDQFDTNDSNFSLSITDSVGIGTIGKEISMKKPDMLLKEYVRRLPDDDLRNLSKCFDQMCGGDRAYIAHTLSQDKQIDRWLSSSTTATEWFDMIDQVGEWVVRECQWRSSNETRKSQRRLQRA